jgi:hypothetical protein
LGGIVACCFEDRKINKMDKKMKILFKSLLTITCLLLIQCCQESESPIDDPIDPNQTTFHVKKAGTLPTLIAESRKYEITELTLTGNLNGTDIRYIREMAGVGVDYQGKLTTLNLSDANIVSGGDAYWSSYYTSNKAIGDYAFRDCRSLILVIIPNNVTSIGKAAFMNCPKLASIIIPNGVTSIGEWAFQDCKGLISIDIPESVISIENYAFIGSGLKSAIIPSKVTSIEEGVFGNCHDLVSVTIPDKVTSIENYAFLRSGLKSVIIPDGVVSIGSAAFEECRSLTSVTIGNAVDSIKDMTFRSCSELISINIPNSVISIGYDAFAYCRGLTSVTIGHSVNSIEKTAFIQCLSLQEIYSKNPIPPAIGIDVFYESNQATCNLYVPKGSLESYKSAYGWERFVNIIEE